MRRQQKEGSLRELHREVHVLALDLSVNPSYLWIPYFDCSIFCTRDISVGAVGHLNTCDVRDDILVLEVLRGVMRDGKLKVDGGLQLTDTG